MAKSNIEWTNCTLNPVTGCTKISDGCKNCYAEKMTKRLQNNPKTPNYKKGFHEVSIHYDELFKVNKMKKPRKIFIGSMADIFHGNVPYVFTDFLMQCIIKNPKHIFQILTKRPHHMEYYFRTVYPFDFAPPNLWLGVTVENKDSLKRIDELKSITKHTSVKFISFEPLLEDVGKLDLTGIDWVIVGGETGAGAREMDSLWLDNIFAQCMYQGVPFFFKQYGSVLERKMYKEERKDYHAYLDGNGGVGYSKIKQFPKTKEG